MIRNWLNVTPAQPQSFTLTESTTRETEIFRSQLWYRGDANELHQFFHQLEGNSGSFWGTAPLGKKVRKIHSGVPAIIVDTLAYIVKSDLDDIETDSELWDEVSEELDMTEIIGQAVVDTLVEGDGAFKLSADTELSPYPIVEFIGGERVEYEYSRGIIKAIVFKTVYTVKSNTYILRERYSAGRIESILYDGSGNERPLDIVPELVGIPPVVEFSGDYIMAVPLRFYASKKHKGRGKSIFDGGKSDCFDALDEVISQWWDAIRAGRVKQYIPESMIPRNPENGGVTAPNQFGNSYITTEAPLQEGVAQKIEVVQPDIKYEAFVSSYMNALLMCLQGLVSPATLGIDVGKMSSAEAQREKKDVTGNTRNTITAALEKALPKLVEAILKTYDNMRNDSPGEYKAEVSFGEYGAPDFDSRVETIGKGATYSIMSVETQVEELWGSSKDDEWKAKEVQRLKSERGLLEASEPSVGGDI